MLFWIFVIFLAAGIAWYIYDDMSIGAMLIITFSAIAVIGALFAILFSHIGKEAKIANWEQSRTAIETKIETGLFADELGILDKNVINEISDYNQTLNSKKALQRDLWVGIFIPNIYDDIELIEYDIIPSRE